MDTLSLGHFIIQINLVYYVFSGQSTAHNEIVYKVFFLSTFFWYKNENLKPISA